MPRWHGYIAIENLALNATQRATLRAALQALGPTTNRQPARLCHWRNRNDGQARIYEADFLHANLTPAKFKQRLGAIFDVSPATIGHTIIYRVFADRATPIITFSRAGVEYLKFAAFGGIGATWQESGDEARAYLDANADEWGA